MTTPTAMMIAVNQMVAPVGAIISLVMSHCDGPGCAAMVTAATVC